MDGIGENFGMLNKVNLNKVGNVDPKWIWTSLVFLLILVGLTTELYLILALPFIFLFIGYFIKDYSILFYLFFLIIPFSIEVFLPNGLGTDLPSEPIMWLLTGLGLVLFLGKKWTAQGLQRYNTPVTWLLLLHLSWIVFTVITASDVQRSAKFLLAKLWYVIPFYFLSIHFFRGRNDILRALKYCFFMLSIAMAYVLINHASQGFSFKSSNDVVQPIFRNHVNYASMVVLFLPYVVLFRSLSQKYKWWYNLILLFFVVCIYFSFTRAAILSILIGVGAYIIIRRLWVERVLIIAVISSIIGLVYLSVDNNYLKFAPDFEKTITHNKFDNLIEATYKMEDISTMERLYRWVAGFEMVKDRPLNGFGPNNFYLNYSKYTISSFQTYVSDNPDQSGIHNYYLMTTVDQGIPGLLVLLALCFVTLIVGQRVYHRLSNEVDKIILMSTLCSFIIILSLNLINDMIETDKVGPFFFLSMAIVSFYYHKSKSIHLGGRKNI